ncbi:MAG: protein-tyrosine-phosphatase [Candidatus Paceibacteria bacterium]|jgi:protein-tyrosine-phosphatase
MSCMRNPELERALHEADSCLFLCSGNMIRSAFAELYASHLGWSLPVRSAGTTYSNSRIHHETRAALLARGVDSAAILSFRPSLITDLSPAVSSGELVLGMTREHLELAAAQGASGPSFLLMEAFSESIEIADPYFEGGFEGVFNDIARCVEALAS